MVVCNTINVLKFLYFIAFGRHRFMFYVCSKPKPLNHLFPHCLLLKHRDGDKNGRWLMEFIDALTIHLVSAHPLASASVYKGGYNGPRPTTDKQWLAQRSICAIICSNKLYAHLTH